MSTTTNTATMSAPPPSDTPRTDAAEAWCDSTSFEEKWSGSNVTAEFARTLERDRNSAVQLNRELLDKLEAMQSELTEARKNADRLYKELSQLTEHICECDESKLLACDDDPHPPSVFHVYSKSAMQALAAHEALTTKGNEA